MLKDKKAEAALQVLANKFGWDEMTVDDIRILSAAALCYLAQRIAQERKLR